MEEKNTYRIRIGKYEGRSRLGKPRLWDFLYMVKGPAADATDTPQP
jgi:hypothetical protein